MDKRESLELIMGVRAAVVYGMTAAKAMPPATLAPLIRGKQWGLEGRDAIIRALDLSAFATILDDPAQAEVVRNNHAILLRHSLVRSTYEIVVGYCYATEQKAEFWAEPWSQFARVIRNTVSHKDGALLERWPAELMKNGTMEVTYRSMTITASQVGTHITLNAEEMFAMHETLYDFLEHGVV